MRGPASQVVLPCNVTGIPAPRVSWFQDDVEVDPQSVANDGTLQLMIPEQAPRESVISFYCTATNRIGRTNSTVATVRSRVTNINVACKNPLL